MKYRRYILVKKKIKDLLIWIIIIMILQLLIILFIYPGYDHWKWLGYPSLPRIIFNTVDNYPGHSINCIKYNDFADKWKGEKNEYVYDNKGDGINLAGIDIHVGDTKSHVQNELRYGNLDKDEYHIVCFLCLWDWYTLRFKYDENDVLIKMTVKNIIHD